MIFGALQNGLKKAEIENSMSDDDLDNTRHVHIDFHVHTYMDR